MRRYKMVASRQVESPFYRSNGRQSRRGFGAVAQISERTTIPFFRENFVSAAKRVSADLLDFAEIVEVVSGFSGQLQKMGEDRLWETVG